MFSVIIPYYNKRKYIERCIDSILDQTIHDFEIIVVDDGSGDDIKELFDEKYPSVNLIQQKNQGVSAARNAGITNSKRDYVCFLDADDVWHSRYLEFAKHIIENNDNVKIIGSRYTRNISLLDDKDVNINYSKIINYFKTALRNTLFTSSSSIVNKDFFKNNRGFNSSLKSGEDIDVWFRVIAAGGNVFYINNILVYYSDEDENQATTSHKKLSERFIGNLESMYFKENVLDNKEFYKFLSKFIYSSLYHFAYNTETKEESSKIKAHITNKYFFAELFYLMPYKAGKLLLKNKKFKKLSRQYFKFIFTYLYN